jgi:hypothetical protein
MDAAQLPQDDPKGSLLQRDEVLRDLVHEHQSLDAHVRELSSQSYLTPEQQLQEAALKKRKLAIKDRIEALLRAQGGAESTA